MSATTYQYVDGAKSTTTLNLITHTVTAGEATANAVVLSTPSNKIVGSTVQITRAGAIVTADANVSYDKNEITIADGATYNVTAGDIITGTVWGSVA